MVRFTGPVSRTDEGVILLVVTDEGRVEQDAAKLPDATPPVWARVTAVTSILLAGAAGGLIGWSVFDLQCDDCATTAVLAGIVSAVACALGVAVVATLSLRAMAEWSAIEARDRARRNRGLQ